jgi:hypothetical protein
MPPQQFQGFQTQAPPQFQGSQQFQPSMQAPSRTMDENADMYRQRNTPRY